MTDTPKRDWAEEIAESLTPYMGSPPRTPEELTAFRARIASPLRKIASDKEAEFIQRERKAKAEGMREAAKMLWKGTWYGDIEIHADKIEKGEA